MESFGGGISVTLGLNIYDNTIVILDYWMLTSKDYYSWFVVGHYQLQSALLLLKLKLRPQNRSTKVIQCRNFTDVLCEGMQESKPDNGFMK